MTNRGFNLADMLKNVADVDLTTVLDQDATQSAQSAQIADQCGVQDNDATAAQGAEQTQDTTTVTDTEAGDGGDGGVAVGGAGGSADGGSGVGIGGAAGDITQSGKFNINFGNADGGAGVGTGGAAGTAGDGGDADSSGGGTDASSNVDVEADQFSDQVEELETDQDQALGADPNSLLEPTSTQDIDLIVDNALDSAAEARGLDPLL